MNQRDLIKITAILCLEYEEFSPEEAVEMIASARNGDTNLFNDIRSVVPEERLLYIVANELSVHFANIDNPESGLTMDTDLIEECDPRKLILHSILPMRHSGGVALVMADPTDANATSYARELFSAGYTLALAPKRQIISQLMQVANTFEPSSAANAVPEWVDYALVQAAAFGTSDVHFNMQAEDAGYRMIVKLRTDGVLRRFPFPDSLRGREREVAASLLAKSASMDSANMRDPQDGTFSFKAAGKTIDVRAAMIPVIGEGVKLTCRLLDPSNIDRKLNDMGFSQQHMHWIRREASAAQGTIVVVGPTGSGKSTTLYTLLGEVDQEEKNVITLEDPVEYRMKGIAQIPIRNYGDKPLTFSHALRNVLRQDPDVILVGEMRDTDTAQVTMEAAITGHMVYSTLHANSAPNAYMRLVDMKVDPFLVSEAVSLILSQRLIRRAHSCASVSSPTEDEAQKLASWGFGDIEKVPRVSGCSGCNGTGYKGRIPVIEVLVPNQHLKAAIGSGASSVEILEASRACGWEPIINDAARHLRAGSTTVSELVRTIVADFVE